MIVRQFDCDISLDMHISHMSRFDKVGARSIPWSIQYSIEYEIIGEGSQISTNQKPGNSAFSLLIG